LHQITQHNFNRIVCIEEHVKTIPYIEKLKYATNKNIGIYADNGLSTVLKNCFSKDDITFQGGNLPIFINTSFKMTIPVCVKILREIMTAPMSWSQVLPILVVNFQSEIANKIMAKENSAYRSGISALIENFATNEIITNVEASKYMPKVQNNSCFMKINPIFHMRNAKIDFDAFDNFLHLIFSKRQSTVEENLKACLNPAFPNAVQLLDSLIMKSRTPKVMKAFNMNLRELRALYLSYFSTRKEHPEMFDTKALEKNRHKDSTQLKIQSEDEFFYG